MGNTNIKQELVKRINALKKFKAIAFKEEIDMLKLKLKSLK